MDPNISILWLVGIPLVSMPLVYLAGRISLRRGGSAAPARWLALLALAASFVPLYFAGSYPVTGVAVVTIFNGISLRFDGISLLVSIVVLALAFLVTLFSASYMRGETGEEKFYALLVGMTGSIIGLGTAGDMFNLWVWFEAMAICSYMLVAFYRNQAASLEAGFKYLVQSATGSILVLIAIALIFAGTGTLNMVDIRAIVSAPTPYILAAGALFIIGFGVKSALVPLHTWLPDAHSQAPSGISAMLSAVVIEAGLIAMLRVLGSLGAASVTWGTLLLIFGAANMLIGNLMALRQTQVKRMLAYSSIVNIGYILLGIGLTLSFGLGYAAMGGFFHIMTHALMKGLAFLAAGALLYALHLANHRHTPLLVSDLNGVSRRYPLTAFLLSVALLALGGLPPLAGFMSKWQIFFGGSQAQSAWVWALIIFTALNSVLSLAYYAPLVNRMYRREPSALVEAGKPVTAVMGASLLVMGVLVAVLGFYPTLVSWVTAPAAGSLIASFGGF
jgi:proton-translocating NADH-quinone oxidoreductase chain N